MPECIILTGDSLTISDVIAVSRDFASIEVDPAAAERADRSRKAVERMLATGEAVYGINTGFGKLAGVRIPPDHLLQLQRNLILSHVAGVGEPLPVEVVRAAMLLRANVLLRETSGVRSVLATHIATMLNAAIHPVVPEQGSVGASGDLAPLSHIAYGMMGEGIVVVGDEDEGTVCAAADALRDAGLEPISFREKEALAFINGTQVQTGMLTLLVQEARDLWRTALGAAAMSLEALMGTPVPFDERIHAARPHPGQVRAAALMRDLLAGSQIRESHRDDDYRVQDAYSLRCTPQILGPVADAIEYAARVAEVELNASTDNPLVFGEEILSGGNFHGQPVALALDVLGIALATLAGLAERRIDRLMNPDLSHGLPPFLTEDAGLNSGLMMAQVTAAALVAEARTLCTPASVQSIPTDASQEDVVPMGMAAAWKTQRVLANARRVVAWELIAAAQGLEFRRPLAPGRGAARVYERVRQVVPKLEGDRPLTPDVERLTALIVREALA
ncbi:MAG: histidine ammonia-lyase [Gemmatimonadota bacterium]|nr:MAG: histidine ammonia-lyase [Gemmatimonadota bacterium]